MVQQAEVRAYRMKPMTPEVRAKVNLSYTESLDLQERALYRLSVLRLLRPLQSEMPKLQGGNDLQSGLLPQTALPQGGNEKLNI